jgi:hypothetical protein
LWSSAVKMVAAEASEEVKREGFRLVFGSSQLRISAQGPTILRFALTRGDIFYTLTVAAEDWCWFVQRQPQKVSTLYLSLLTLNIPSLSIPCMGFPLIQSRQVVNKYTLRQETNSQNFKHNYCLIISCKASA